MATHVELKQGAGVPEPLTEFEWKRGYIDGYCRAADNRCYAIVVTEKNELEYVPIHMLRVIDDFERWEQANQ